MQLIMTIYLFYCSYHILTSSVIYYWTDARQHGIYLLSCCTTDVLSQVRSWLKKGQQKQPPKNRTRPWSLETHRQIPHRSQWYGFLCTPLKLLQGKQKYSAIFTPHLLHTSLFSLICKNRNEDVFFMITENISTQTQHKNAIAGIARGCGSWEGSLLTRLGYSLNPLAWRVRVSSESSVWPCITPTLLSLSRRKVETTCSLTVNTKSWRPLSSWRSN